MLWGGAGAAGGSRAAGDSRAAGGGAGRHRLGASIDYGKWELRVPRTWGNSENVS